MKAAWNHTKMINNKKKRDEDRMQTWRWQTQTGTLCPPCKETWTLTQENGASTWLITTLPIREYTASIYTREPSVAGPTLQHNWQLARAPSDCACDSLCWPCPVLPQGRISIIRHFVTQPTITLMQRSALTFASSHTFSPLMENK